MTLAELRREQGAPVVLADQQGSILSVNPPFTAAFGWKTEDLAGRSVACLLPERLRDAFHLALARLLRAGAPEAFPAFALVLLARDGRELDTEVALAVERGAAGWLVGAVLRPRTALAPRPEPRDLEERLETQGGALGRLEGALEALGDAVVLADAAGRVLWCTRAAEAALGRPALEVLGRPASEVLAGLSGLESKPLAQEGKEPATVYRLRPSRELEGLGLSIAHELRTPLRGIRMFSKALLQEHAHELGGDGRRILGVIHDNSERMARLIDELLDLARLVHKPLHLSPVDMDDLAAGVWSDLKPLAEGRALALELKPLPATQGDLLLLRQVLTNLLSNAVKFTARASPAVIELAGREEAERTVYWVKDNGIGFDMADAGQLFRVFQRLNAADEFEGAGVGLALVQRIVERHGGRVWAEGRPGSGAAFYFSLPRTTIRQNLESRIENREKEVPS